MYLDPFWAGVAVTLVTEVIAMAIYGFVTMKQAEKELNHETRTVTERNQ